MMSISFSHNDLSAVEETATAIIVGHNGKRRKNLTKEPIKTQEFLLLKNNVQTNVRKERKCRDICLVTAATHNLLGTYTHAIMVWYL